MGHQSLVAQLGGPQEQTTLFGANLRTPIEVSRGLRFPGNPKKGRPANGWGRQTPDHTFLQYEMCKGGPLAISMSIPTKGPMTRQSSQAMAFAYLSFQSLASRILPNKQRTSCPSVDLLLWSGVLLKPLWENFPTKLPPSRLRFLYKLARNFQWSDIVAGYLTDLPSEDSLP